MQQFLLILLSLKESFIAKCIASLCVAFGTMLIGSNVVVIKALMILVAIDFFSGIMRDVKHGVKITSRAMRGTIRKVILFFFLLAAVHQVAIISPSLMFFESWAAGYIAAHELLSIIENLSQAGLIIPKPIVKKLQKYLDTGNLT